MPHPTDKDIVMRRKFYRCDNCGAKVVARNRPRLPKGMLPSGALYSKGSIKFSLIAKLNFIMSSPDLKEERGYYYIMKSDILKDFREKFKARPPRWLFKTLKEKEALRVNPKTGRKGQWYRMYKADYECVKKLLEEKFPSYSSTE